MVGIVNQASKVEVAAKFRTLSQRHIGFAIIVGVLSVLTFGLQVWGGAYQKELAHWPDEPAHVVTAMMVHDYVSMGMPEAPQRFAERYYAHYPKVAIGIWPPLYYVIAASWMFPFGVSRFALLLLSGTVTVILSSVLAFWVRRLYGSILGLLAGGMLITLARTQWNSSTFMLDGMVAVASLVAMQLMLRFFRTESMGAAVALGLATGGAILVKGNAHALILMIALLALVTRRMNFKKPHLYVTGAIVLLLSLPWDLLTLRLLARGQNVHSMSISNTLTTLRGYLLILTKDFTPLVGGLILLGLVIALAQARRSAPAQPLDLAAAACLFLAVIIFHCVVPLVGILDARYLTPAIAPAIVLFLAGCQHASRWRLPPGASPNFRLGVLISIALISAAGMGAFAGPGFPALGFRQAANLALAANDPSCTMLVCSDAIGEGAFVSEVALRDRKLSRVVLRGSKAISESPWNGQTFKMLFQNERALALALDAQAVDVVVVDQSSLAAGPTRDLLLAALRYSPDNWSITPLAGTYERTFGIYTRKNRGDLKWNTIRVPMPFNLGREIELNRR